DPQSHTPQIERHKKTAGAPVTLGAPQRPVPKPPQRLLTMAQTPLEVGDFMPFFEISDTNRKTRAIEVYGGRHSLFFYLPVSNVDYATRFFRELQRQMQDNPNMWQMFTLDD